MSAIYITEFILGNLVYNFYKGLSLFAYEPVSVKTRVMT